MWEDLMKIQCREKILETLETAYLVEMNTVALVSECHGNKKYTQNRKNVTLFDINKDHKLQNCVWRVETNVRKIER